ncbi:MAG: hypothetical protein IKR48_05550 [Kiritimatiellae bacterium]|nr:hypothetical protein [Kiritimatiellia bacterium]
MKKFVVMMAAATALFSAMGETYKGGYTYAGVMTMYSDNLGQTVPIGLATVKVAGVTKTKTCKVIMQIQKANLKKYSISGLLKLNADSTQLQGKIYARGKGTWEAEQIDTEHFEMHDPNTGIQIKGLRNYLEGADAKKWSGKLSPFVGTWNAEISTDKYGQALINCVVNSKGVVKVKTYGWHLAKTGYASVCTTKLVTEGSEAKCEIPINFMKLATKKNVSAALNLILKQDLRQAKLTMELDSKYMPDRNGGCYAILSSDSLKTGAGSYSEISYGSFSGGKGANRPAGDYYIHGDMRPLYLHPAVGDYKMFGLPLLATLSYPEHQTSLKVSRLGWLTPKATKITSTTTLPIGAANESGIKVTNNSKTYTYKGSYYSYVVLANRVKKYPAKFIGFSWREYNGDEVNYLSVGYAFSKGPRGQIEYNYTCIDPLPPDVEDDEEDDGDDDDE